MQESLSQGQEVPYLGHAALGGPARIDMLGRGLRE